MQVLFLQFLYLNFKDNLYISLVSLSFGPSSEGICPLDIFYNTPTVKVLSQPIHGVSGCISLIVQKKMHSNSVSEHLERPYTMI